MKIPLFQQTQTPTAGIGQVQTLPGEKVSPKTIPKTEAMRWSALKANADSVFDISIKMEQAESQTEFQNSMLKMKDAYAELDQKITQDPAFKDMNVKELETYHNEASIELREGILGDMKHYQSKKTLTREGTNMSINSRVKAENWAYSNVIDKGRASTLKSLESLSNSFITSGSIDDLALAEASIKGSVAAGFYNKQEGVKLLQGFNNAAIAGYYDNVIQDTPIELHNQVIRDEEEPEAFKTLEESVKTVLKKRIVAGYNKKMTELKVDAVGTWQNKSLDAPEDTWDEFKKIPKRKFDSLFNDNEYATLKKQLKASAERAKKAKEVDSIDPVLKGRLDRMLEDALAQVVNVGIQPGGVEDAIGIVYSANDKTKRRGQAVLENYKADAKLNFGKYAVDQDIKNDTVANNTEYLINIKPVEGSKDFKTRQAVYESAVTTFENKVELLSDDPKTLFDSYFPQKRPTSNNPSIRIKENQQYAVALTDWYKKQGLPKSMWKVMSNDEAKIYVDNISNKPVKEIIDDVLNIQNSYGPLAKIAFRDLSEAGFPTSLRLIADLKPNQLSTVGVDLANSYKLKEADFAKAMGVEAMDRRETINNIINTDKNIINYVSSVYTQGTTSNNIKVVADLKNAVRKLSYIYTMRGIDDKDAVEKASSAILGNRYGFVEINDMTVRVPFKLNNSIVKKYMRNVIKGMDYSKLSGDYIDKGLSAAMKKNQEYKIVNEIKDSAYWKNVSGSTTIVVLVDKNGIPILNKENKPIAYDLDQKSMLREQ